MEDWDWIRTLVVLLVVSIYGTAVFSFVRTRKTCGIVRWVVFAISVLAVLICAFLAFLAAAMSQMDFSGHPREGFDWDRFLRSEWGLLVIAALFCVYFLCCSLCCLRFIRSGWLMKWGLVLHGVFLPGMFVYLLRGETFSMEWLRDGMIVLHPLFAYVFLWFRMVKLRRDSHALRRRASPDSIEAT